MFKIFFSKNSNLINNTCTSKEDLEFIKGLKNKADESNRIKKEESEQIKSKLLNEQVTKVKTNIDKMIDNGKLLKEADLGQYNIRVKTENDYCDDIRQLVKELPTYRGLILYTHYNEYKTYEYSSCSLYASWK